MYGDVLGQFDGNQRRSREQDYRKTQARGSPLESVPAFFPVGASFHSGHPNCTALKPRTPILYAPNSTCKRWGRRPSALGQLWPTYFLSLPWGLNRGIGNPKAGVRAPPSRLESKRIDNLSLTSDPSAPR